MKWTFRGRCKAGVSLTLSSRLGVLSSHHFGRKKARIIRRSTASKALANRLRRMKRRRANVGPMRYCGGPKSPI
jgi:hypothetical protein